MLLEKDLVGWAKVSQGMFVEMVSSGYGLSQASPCVMA